MLEIQTAESTTSKPIFQSQAQHHDALTTYAQQPEKPKANLRTRQYVASSACLRKKCYCACHRLQVISGSFWALGYPVQSIWGSCNLNSCAKYKRASLWINLSRIGLPYAVIASLDILWTAHRASIAPSLEVKRVVSWDAPAFKAIRDIRWNGVDFQEARASIAYIFGAGKASPVDILSNGETLLEVSQDTFEKEFSMLTF